MCYSPEASFTVAAILAGIGILSYQVMYNSKHKMLVSIPFLFSIQQLFEGLVWLSFLNYWAISVHNFFVYSYLIFAYLIWPIWIPTALFKIETNKQKKKLISYCAAAGTLVSSSLLLALLIYPVTAQIVGHHIVYKLPVSPLFIYTGFILYLLAVITPFFIVRKNYLALFGLGVLLSAVLSAYISFTAFGSIWCFFSAILSFYIYQIERSWNKKKK